MSKEVRARLSIGGLVARLAGGFIGIGLLYVLGAGPGAYIYERSTSERTRELFFTIYDPLLISIRGTPLEGVMAEYQIWWTELARRQSAAP